jgi:hypothetical protein
MYGSAMNAILQQLLYSLLISTNMNIVFSSIILYTVSRSPWTGDQPVARPRYLHTGQHKHRINVHRHPCLQWDSNQRSRCLSEQRRFMPQNARPPWWSVHWLRRQLLAYCRILFLEEECIELKWLGYPTLRNHRKRYFNATGRSNKHFLVLYIFPYVGMEGTDFVSAAVDYIRISMESG